MIYSISDPEVIKLGNLVQLIMLALDFLIPTVICCIIKGNFFNLVALLVYLIYMNVTYLFSSVSSIGGFSTLINLLTNTAVNYYTLLLLILFWTNDIKFFNKVTFVTLLSLNYTTVFISNNLNTNSVNILLPKSLINLDLFNGVLSIHPLMLLLSCTTIGYLLITMLTSRQLVTTNLLTDRFIKVDLTLHKTKLNKDMFRLRSLSFLALYLNILSIILGSYWAHQELSWGGYWSWDPIEVFSLIILMLALLISHSFKNIVIFSILPLTLVILIAVLSLVRLNAVSSIHGFLDVQDLRFSLTTFTALLLIVLLALSRTLCRLTTTILYPKYAVLRYLLKSLKALVIGLNTIFFAFSAFYLLSVLLINSIKPLQYNQFVLCLLLFIIAISIKQGTALLFLLPILEAIFVRLVFLNYRFYFLTKITHFIILTLFIFFINYSHIFFIDTVSLNQYNAIPYVIDKAAVLSSLFYQYFNDVRCTEMGVPAWILNKNCYIDSIDPYLMDTVSNLSKNKIEQFYTYFFKGLDSIYFGSNLFLKRTCTYPLFILSSFWVITYLITSKNKKSYNF